LALYRGQKSGPEIAGAMNRNRDGLAAFRENVVAAVNSFQRPTGGPQLCNDFFASYRTNDRSLMI